MFGAAVFTGRIRQGARSGERQQLNTIVTARLRMKKVVRDTELRPASTFTRTTDLPASLEGAPAGMLVVTGVLKIINCSISTLFAF